MVRIQNLFGQLQIKIVFSKLFPGQTEQRIQIAPDNGAFCHHRRHFIEAVEFLLNLFYYLFRHIKLSHGALVLIDFSLTLVALAEFLVNSLHLLAQIIFSLVLLYLFADLLRNVLLDIGYFQFLAKIAIKQIHAVFDINCFQHAFFFVDTNGQITGNHIRNSAGVRLVLKSQKNFAGYFLAGQNPLFKSFDQHAFKCFHLVAVNDHTRYFLNFGFKINFFIITYGFDFGSRQALNQNS